MDMEEEEDLSRNNNQQNMTYIHLVVFGKDVETVYYERCEVVLRHHKIYVTPDDVGADKLWRTIDNNFIRLNNVISFFSTTRGFALLFDHKRDCRHVYNELMKKRVGNNNTQMSDAVLEKRFIIPMINELYNYSELDFEFVFFILKFLRSLDIEQKQRLAPMIIETGIEQGLLDRILIGVDLSAKEQETSTRKPKYVDEKDEIRDDKTGRKRRSTKESSSSTMPTLVDQDDSVEGDNDSSTDNQESKKSMQVPVAENDMKNYDSDEEDSPAPAKKPRLSTRSTESSSPNQEPITTPFQVIDYTQSGITKSHLFIFTDETRTSCHEYYWESRRRQFKCCKCKKRGPVTRTDDNEVEQVYFSIPQCACDPRPFDPDCYKDDIYVYKPDYNIVDEQRKRGKVQPKLYIYTSEDKKKAYKFAYEEKNNRYLCIKCRSLHHQIRAITCVNDDEEEYIAIQEKPHKCEPIDC